LFSSSLVPHSLNLPRAAAEAHRYVAFLSLGILFMSPVLYPILGWSFVIVAALTPVLVIIGSIRNYRLRSLDFETLRFKAIAAIFIWLVLTFGLFVLFGFLAYVIGHAMSQDRSLQPRPTPEYVAIHIIYFSVCYLLVDWVWRRKRVHARGAYHRPQHNKRLERTRR